MNKICVICDKEFETNYSNKIYCSKECVKIKDYIYNRDHQRTLESKIKKQAYYQIPKVKDKRKAYYQKPEVVIKRENPEVKEHTKEYMKVYYQTNPEKYLESNKKALIKLGLEFKLPYLKYMYALYSWSKAVRHILGESCSICKSTDGLNSHHIFPKAKYPLLSLNVNNGIPLCKEHHLEVHRLN
jgi:5-methylcytosine-specific restriction endonuclease McrA